MHSLLPVLDHSHIASMARGLFSLHQVLLSVPLDRVSPHQTCSTATEAAWPRAAPLPQAFLHKALYAL